MIKIRLRRVGARKQPSYRVVVADSKTARDGRFVETIGFYNPRTEPETVQIDEGRALYWLNVGAQPTEAVARLLEKQGTMARFARLKAGEPLEVLQAEADAGVAPAPRPVQAVKAEEAKEASVAADQGEEDIDA
jgi:small subunit ribosomal protein S16